MPRKRIAGKIRREALTYSQRLDLLLGAGHEPWTDEQRKQAWFDHRDELLYSLNPGTRPEAFWDYEQKRLLHESNAQALFRLGLLTPEELETLDKIGPIKPATGKDPREILRG